jgi:hypothetical protein
MSVSTTVSSTAATAGSFPLVWADDRFTTALTGSGCRPAAAAAAEVLVLDASVAPPAGLPADAPLVVVVGTGPADPAVTALLDRAGVRIRPTAPALTTVTRPVIRDLRTAPVFEDLLSRVDPARLLPTALLEVPAGADVALLSGGAPVVAVARSLAVLAVAAGPTGAPDLAELLRAAVFRVAPRRAGRSDHRDSGVAGTGEWLALKAAVTQLRTLQEKDGSIPAERAADARPLLDGIDRGITALTEHFEHDRGYLDAVRRDLRRWADGGYEVPDFLDSLQEFHPERQRVDGREHLVVFPMYTQNGNPDRNLEAVLVQVIWPEFVADLEAGDYSNAMFVPIRFLDFTPGYDTNSAVLFPETVAMREVPVFTWGAIFADREAARFRAVVSAAAEVTRLALPPDAARLLSDQQLAEQTFVTWDLIHDRTHMHGDLPFDPFMIKQRMPYFLYTLEELRCDLTAFREAVALEQQGLPHARLVQYAILFDRIFRFPITGSRVRNYDGLGGQLLFAWLHQRGVLHWTDNRLAIDWPTVAGAVLELGEAIEDLYWRSIDRPKVTHWLAAYDLVRTTLTPHPASAWDRRELPLDGPPKGLTDAVLPDEFPLSMFYEALQRKLAGTVQGTAGITG